ncbi:MAG: tetratricopeptide repeat protein [Phycisphaerales bacterium]
MISSRLAAMTLSAAALIAASGCTGQGRYTGDFKEKSQLRMAGMKAATEFDMARQQFLAGDLAKALRTTDRSIEINPEVAKSHVLRARILFEQGRLEAAMLALDRAMEIDAEDVLAHYYRGLVHERFTHYELAHHSYMRAREIDPADPQYTLAAAEMLIQLDRLADARELLESDRERFDHNAGLRQTLGHIAMMQDRYEDAVALFNEATLLAPDEVTLREDLIHAQVAGGKFADAERNLRIVTERLSEEGGAIDRPDLRILHAQTLVALERPVEARTILLADAGRDAMNADVRTWIELGNIALMIEDDHGLRQAGQRLVAMAPYREDGYVMLAMFHRRQGNPREALALLDRAIQMVATPEDAPVLRALILTDLGLVQDARETLYKALDRNPENAMAMDFLGVIGDTRSAFASADPMEVLVDPPAGHAPILAR